MAKTKSKTVVPEHIKSDPRFTALVAALKSDAKALAAFERVNPTEDPRIQELVDAGFTRDQAVAALSDDAPTEAPKVEAVPDPKPEDVKAEFVASQGFAFARGRVYSTKALIEAQARVMRSGKAEVVASSGVGRTKAVLVSKEASGDLALQNLVPATEG